MQLTSSGHSRWRTSQLISVFGRPGKHLTKRSMARSLTVTACLLIAIGCSQQPTAFGPYPHPDPELMEYSAFPQVVALSSVRRTGEAQWVSKRHGPSQSGTRQQPKVRNLAREIRERVTDRRVVASPFSDGVALISVWK
jgi:hypothetical protein